MEFSRLFVRFLGTAALGFAVTAGVTYLYSSIAHGTGVVDWETAFRLAVILGIVLTVIGERKPLK